MPETRRMRLDPVDIKLLILYLLKQAERPLSATEITDFVLADSLLDFFETHHYISALLDEKQIEETAPNTYQLTESGAQAIAFFENRLPYTILEKIQLKMKANQKQELLEQLVSADYIPLNDDEFQIHLTMQEAKDTVPFEIKFIVNGKETAKNICNRWKTDYASLYIELTNLFSQL
ncbi:MAG: DUF4364 family protein [Ruminococcaceae bacterium]|nr:DUF4364 family protein [Oscillospiraceae bacterium]